MTSRRAPFSAVSALALPFRLAGLVLAATPSLPHFSQTPGGYLTWPTESARPITSLICPAKRISRLLIPSHLIESPPRSRTICGDGGVLLPRAQSAARNVQRRRAADSDGSRRVRALGARQASPRGRRQPDGHPAPQDYPAQASERADGAG